MLLWKPSTFWMIKNMSQKVLINLQAAKDRTLRKWNKLKSFKQKMKDRVWVWEETTLRIIIKRQLFSNNMLKIKTTNQLIKSLHSEEVTLLIIRTRKLILHPILIYNNLVHCRNSMRKILHMMFLWISSQTHLQDWIIHF